MRKYLFTAFVLMIAAQAQADRLPELNDLKTDLTTMQNRGIPMLVFFHGSYCHYCHEAEANFLEPLSRNPEFAERTLFRRVGLDTGRMIFDEQGEKILDREFARRFNVRLVPTVIFLGPDGEQLGPPVVGIANYDFYGGQIERALRTAEACLADPMLEQCSH